MKEAQARLGTAMNGLRVQLAGKLPPERLDSLDRMLKSLDSELGRQPVCKPWRPRGSPRVFVQSRPSGPAQGRGL
jgi:hypothetical protein